MNSSSSIDRNENYKQRTMNFELTTRRDFLWQSGGGLGGIALAAMLGEEQARAGELPAFSAASFIIRRKRNASCSSSWRARPVTSTSLISSPKLVKRHGQPSDFGEHVEAFQNGLGRGRNLFGNSSPTARVAKCSAKSCRNSAASSMKSHGFITSSARPVFTLKGHCSRAPASIVPASRAQARGQLRARLDE